ncbi:ankyrin [Acephala macrosclerotiorum]|nr:ankyrin [Acephala macrosclerotiorum]
MDNDDFVLVERRANLVRTLKDENAPVLFFFSRRIIKSNSDPCHLVRDCLYQFLDHSIALQVRLKRLTEQHSDVASIPFHELWRILLSALSAVPKVYVLFDALDELAVEENDFLQCLQLLAQKKPNSIRLVITSRPLPHLQTKLVGSCFTNIRLGGRMVENDIATYVTHRMINQQERTLKVKEQSIIKDVLCQKSQGLFLYARLMLDEILQRSASPCDHLEHLPNSLGDMYVDLLHEHSIRSGASLQFQSMLLSWVTHSSRPFRVSELAALINSLGLKGSQDAQVLVRTSCGPLLEILEDDTVQVIHHSFTEFLLDNSRTSAKEASSTRKWFPAFMPVFVHRFLSVACINYLMSGCFESWSVNERRTEIDSRGLEKQKQIMVQFQFLQYASQNLLYHAAKCDSIDPDLASRFDSFLQYGSHDFESWKDFLFLKEVKSIPDDFHPLHLAARAGLTSYTIHLLEKGAAPDIVDSQGRTATAYCAIHGHAETLATLLRKRASFTIHDLDGLAPIHHAAKGNHVKVLQCLLDAGANPMSPKSDEDDDHYYWNPSTIGTTSVQYACETGNGGVVSELLQRLSPESRTAILPHWASSTGQANVLSMLLQYPEILANINTKDSCGNTALYLAACAGDSSTVRILLQHGADVHSRSADSYKALVKNKPLDFKVVNSGPGRTPLQGWAHFKRPSGCDVIHSNVDEWEKTATLLIEAGSDIEAKDEKGKTVLFAWTEQYGYGRGDSDRTDRFVTLLLRHGANPRATDDEGSTALHQQQSWYQSPGVIERLTKAGENINQARESDLVTPLIAAGKRQMKAVDVRAYIENGAKPNMQDSDGNTALHHICKSWLPEFEDLKEWLKFADPTIKNNRGETCVYNLRWGNGGEGRVNAIPLMVEKGLDLESRDRLGRTALLAACCNAQPKFISGLIRFGADARVKDFQHKSCK